MQDVGQVLFLFSGANAQQLAAMEQRALCSTDLQTNIRTLSPGLFRMMGFQQKWRDSLKG